MEFKDYQVDSGRTRNLKVDEATNYALGMVCEAGEVGDIIKKYSFHGHELDKEELIKELGDTLWYMANLCTVFDISLTEVADKNIAKLLKRYPERFTQEDSINRKE